MAGNVPQSGPPLTKAQSWWAGIILVAFWAVVIMPPDIPEPWGLVVLGLIVVAAVAPGPVVLLFKRWRGKS